MLKIKIETDVFEVDKEGPSDIYQSLIDELRDGGFIILYKKGFLHINKQGVKQPEKTLIKFLESRILSFPENATNIHRMIPLLSDLLSTQWQRPLSDPSSITIIKVETIPPCLFNFLLPHIRWSAASSGDRIFLVRTSEIASCWEIASDPWGSLSQRTRDNGENYLTYLSNEFDRLQTTGDMTWGIDSFTDTETGKVTRTRKSFLSLVSSVKFEEMFKQDLRFMLPLPVAFTNNKETPASCYFPLNALPTSPDPSQYSAWTDFESQMPDWSVPIWRAGFYGIFDERNRSRQMLILFDNGQTGKSNMIRAITKIATGNFYTAISKDALINNFWGSKILGRRLVVFSDTGNQKITQMDKMKQISGGDPIDCELKGISGQIHFTPNCRVLITTNSRPEINTHNKHQISRVLIFPLTATKDEKILCKFCKLDDTGKVQYNSLGEPIVIGARYDDWMATQFLPYLAACKPFYEELCPNHQEVIVNEGMLEYITGSCVSSTTDAINHMMTNYLEFTEFGRMSNTDLRIVTDHLAGSIKDPDLKFDEVCDYLLTRDCKRGRFKLKNTVVRGIVGVNLRPGVTIQNDRVVFRDPNIISTATGIQGISKPPELII